MSYPDIPKDFPCWCRALYSWSGERNGKYEFCRDKFCKNRQEQRYTKHELGDLGFVEGDWIECLNPGDGNFWYGRLKRNRAEGMFPKNFIHVVQMPLRTSKSAAFHSEIPRKSRDIEKTRSRSRPPDSRSRSSQDIYSLSGECRGRQSVQSRYSISGKGDSTSPRRYSRTRTPSPLRNAMDELMESLGKLGSPVLDSSGEEEEDEYFDEEEKRNNEFIPYRNRVDYDVADTILPRTYSQVFSASNPHNEIATLQEDYRREMLALSKKHSFEPGTAVEMVYSPTFSNLNVNSATVSTISPRSDWSGTFSTVPTAYSTKNSTSLEAKQPTDIAKNSHETYSTPLAASGRSRNKSKKSFQNLVSNIKSKFRKSVMLHQQAAC